MFSKTWHGDLFEAKYIYVFFVKSHNQAAVFRWNRSRRQVLQQQEVLSSSNQGPNEAWIDPLKLFTLFCDVG